MIIDPVNDIDCLLRITEAARAKVHSQEVIDLAARFPSLAALRAWMRSLPQRMDLGDPADGPKVMCDVAQRLVIPSQAPNCVERAALYLAVAEWIEASRIRCLATIDTPQGRHTFPVENGRPVVLDPKVPRNAMLAGLDAIDELDGRARPLTFRGALYWIVEVAAEPACAYPNGTARARRAREVAASVVDGRHGELTREDLFTLLWACALAEREAPLWGPRRARAVERTVDELHRRVEAHGRRNRLHVELMPADELARSAGRVAKDLAPPLAIVAVKATLASQGIPPQVVDLVVGELSKESARTAADVREERAPQRRDDARDHRQRID